MKYTVLLVFIFLLFIPVVLSQECDEDDERTCGYEKIGECRSGVQLCQGGVWSMCFGARGPVEEICDDNKDNDCDGDIDEQCECTTGETQSCGPETTEGICQQGTQECIDGEWSECEDAVYSFPEELCGQDGYGNNADDNCDGQVDEGCNQRESQALINCFNGKQDSNEEGIDCGGSCRTCSSCTDRILNQGETKVSQDLGNARISDCGGPNCPACPTCNDGAQNQGEQGIDCDGPCEPCVKKEDTDDDNDGLTHAEEIRLGSSPFNPDTDNDGIMDGQDAQPLCPDGVCQEQYGETSKNCDDCKNPSILPITFSLFFILVVLGGIFLFYRKMKQTKAQKKKTIIHVDQPQQSAFDLQRYKQLQDKKKKRKKTPLETELEKSFNKADQFLKK